MRSVTGSRALPPNDVRPLARRALQGEWASDALTEGWAPALGVAQAAALAHRVLDLLPGGPHDAADPLATLDRLLRDLPAVPLADADATSPPARSGVRDPRPPRPWRFGVRELQTTAELARLLDLTPDELAWFADTGHWLRHSAPPLRHYAAHLQPTVHGGARLIEAPKPRLREIQRRLLRHVLARVPTHDVAHGFVPGRSARTAATVHAGHPVLVRADLRQFFASVTASRVRVVFRVLGYPSDVAANLTGLCTTRTRRPWHPRTPSSGCSASWSTTPSGWPATSATRCAPCCTTAPSPDRRRRTTTTTPTSGRTCRAGSPGRPPATPSGSPG